VLFLLSGNQLGEVGLVWVYQVSSNLYVQLSGDGKSKALRQKGSLKGVLSLIGDELVVNGDDHFILGVAVGDFLYEE
jgi:hypothetical protein